MLNNQLLYAYMQDFKINCMATHAGYSIIMFRLKTIFKSETEGEEDKEQQQQEIKQFFSFLKGTEKGFEPKY